MAADLLTQYVEYLESLDRSPDTVGNFRRTVRRFAAFVRKPVEDITVADVQSYLDHCRRTCTHNTVVSYHTVLKSFFRWVVEVKRYVPENPAAAIRLRKPVYAPRHFLASLDDIGKLIAAARNLKERVIIGLGLAGLRAIEISRLLVSDIMGDYAVVRGKGNPRQPVKYRVVPFDDHLTALVATYIEEYRPEDRLIGHCRNHIINIVIAAARRAGVKASSHILRHTFATHALRESDIVSVMDLLGHADIRTTMIYLHSDPDRLRGVMTRLSYAGLLDASIQTP